MNRNTTINPAGTRSRATALLVAGALALAVVQLRAPAGAAEQIVEMKGLSFIPEELAISVGDTVTWVNHDEDHHDIEGGPVNSPEMAKDQTYSFTFEKPFAFEYKCKIHTYMRGKVTAGDGSAGTGADEPPPSSPAPPPESPPPTKPPGGPLGLPLPLGIG